MSNHALDPNLVTIETPTPHSANQRLLMSAFHIRGLNELWIANGTKWGKSLGGGSAIGSVAPLRKNNLFRWVAPIYQQAKIGFKYCKRILPSDPYVDINNSGPSITIPSIETIIEFWHGQHPTSLEGEACNGYILDECAKMKEDVYSAAKTTVTVTRGPIVGFSTPLGKNWFFHKCMEAKAEYEWALAKGIAPRKVFITAPTSDNPWVSKEAIEQARKDLPERLFRQYYLAEFLDDGSTFLGFRECYYTDPIDMYEAHQVWTHPEEAKKAHVVIGADWAKSVDWTVFIAVDINTRRVVGFERFHKWAYTEAIRQLVRFAKRFGEVAAIWHDKTGVGQAIDDQLAYTSLPYQGIIFSNASKSNMVNGLITTIESKRIGLPRWNVLDTELDIYEVAVNPIGTMTYSAPDGKHDDTVSALMLANAALDQYGDRDVNIKFLEDLAKEEQIEKPEPGSLEAYYNDLAEDED